MVNRLLDIKKILGQHRSALLLGPRGVGKTRLSKEFIKTCSLFLEINLLHHDLFTRYVTQPSLFRHEVEFHLRPNALLTVFVDEVQKIPALLDEVHGLLEEHKGRVRFLLTGSSARKLKRGGANLLAGRAWTLKLHPLTHRECSLDLARALQFGTLPAMYLEEEMPERTLKTYVETYLREEIMQEALVRRLDGYVRFLDMAGQMNGEPLNFAALARESGVTTKTIQGYVDILVDTLVVFRFDAWTRSVRKQLRHSPKIYFFDCGVLNALSGELGTELKKSSYRYGKLFETFIVQEMVRLNDYMDAGFRFYYWRTNTGLEVDVVLSRGHAHPPIAIEIKSKPSPGASDLHALISFAAENEVTALYCFCTTPHAYKVGEVTVYPWQEGLSRLFSLTTAQAG